MGYRPKAEERSHNHGRDTCFSLRTLPFGFLTRHVRAAFPPTWSAESSLLVLQGGILANKKAHVFGMGPLFAGSPNSGAMAPRILVPGTGNSVFHFVW
jgi:hypothetical protein